MTHEVFISYSVEDKPIADAICAHLEADGVRCWIAPRDILPGEDRPGAITRAISQGQVLILVFSAHSNASDDISRELFLAADSKLVIIPFKIENIEPEPGKRYYLARTHWLDALNPPTQEQIQNLVQRVKTLVPLKGPAISPVRTQIETPLSRATMPEAGLPIPAKQRRSPWLWAIPVGLVLLGLIGWGSFSLISRMIPFASPPTQTQEATPVVPPTSMPTIPLKTAAASPTGLSPLEFTQTYISEPFNDNSQDWPVGDSTGQDWQGTLAITGGVLEWDGNSVTRMNAFIRPRSSSLQADLTDQEISTRINLISPDSKGVYGLYLRASGDRSRFYAFYVLNDQFAFFALTGENNWHTLYGWEYSQAVTGEGWIKMSVQAGGSHFRLFVNDQMLTELDDSSIASGQSGLLVTAYTPDMAIHAQFDDFTVLLPSP